jgi:predicted adenylyl cyclase CyaB
MQNVEAKFRLLNVAAAHQKAEAIGFEHIATITQRDTFFAVSKGKLKLREQPDGAWLIRYQRSDADGLQLSDYEIVTVSEPPRLRELLSAALGVAAEVRKHRILLQRANVRLHLDKVTDLGTFGEIEAILEPGDDPSRSRSEVSAILMALKVPSHELIGESYFELMR